MTGKFSSKKPRVPLPVSGIQVNFCKVVNSGNLGAPPPPLSQKRGSVDISKVDYVATTKKPYKKVLLVN